MNASTANITIWSADAIRAAVDVEDLIEPTVAAFTASSAGLVQNGLITMFPGSTPEAGDVYVKTGAVAGDDVHIVKVSPWFARNAEQRLPQGGFVAVMDSRTGHTLGLLDDQHYLSDIRTAAAGVVAARLFAPARVDVACVLGSGTQAWLQPQALYRERQFEQLHIWARDIDKAMALAQRLRVALPGVDVRVERRIERAVRAADVLMTTTTSREPLVKGEWLKLGSHVSAFGADDATKCELDLAVLRRARVFVDSVPASTLYGDVRRAIATGGYRPDEIAGEIGSVLAGRVDGRTQRDDITVAKFVGIGAQDLAAAQVAIRKLSLMSTTGKLSGQ
jgi:ornithine cyclodeaminase/alanine dehydrogenase-like protein (mu-crystallin family)